MIITILFCLFKSFNKVHLMLYNVYKADDEVDYNLVDSLASFGVSRVLECDNERQFCYFGSCKIWTAIAHCSRLTAI